MCIKINAVFIKIFSAYTRAVIIVIQTMTATSYFKAEMCAIMEHHLLNNIATLITRAQRQQFLVHSDACCVLTLMKAIVIRYIGERKGEALGRKGRSGERGTTLLFRCRRM